MKIKTKAPPPAPEPTPLPTIDDAEVDTRKRRALLEMKGRKGRGSTLLTGGPLGDATGSSYRPLLA